MTTSPHTIGRPRAVAAPHISIIIPCLDSEEDIGSLLSQLDAVHFGSLVEVVVIDNGSADKTLETARAFSPRTYSLKVLEYTASKGPGVARDEGIRNAAGEWIFFLDSDDRLHPDGFAELEHHLLNSPNHEIVAFNWAFEHEAATPGNRVELDTLHNLTRTERVERFLKHEIDPSVIFTALRRDFIARSNITFRDGLHEDVDFSFKALYSCQSIGVVESTVYLKKNRQGSIVNTLSSAHIKGYFGAALEIKNTLRAHGHLPDTAFEYFVVSLAGSRLGRYFRAGVQNQISLEDISQLLRDEVAALINLDAWCYKTSKKSVEQLKKWEKVFFHMVQISKDKNITREEMHDELHKECVAFWSCYDLQKSVFLAPDEIRTCCKRFFIDGEQRGDAVLLDKLTPDALQTDVHDVIRAKKSMIKNINNHSEAQCNGCPHLRYEIWPEPLSDGIEYLSLEYHSLCNMKCNYCSEKYWDGRRPFYDIERMINSFAESGMLKKPQYLVWGGGEPTLDKNFDHILGQLSELPGQSKIRVITNSTLFKPRLAELMSEDRAFIITSFDAGDAELFNTIRGSRHFESVTKNLQKYVESSSKNTVIKYILQDDNADKATLVSFQRHMQASGLINANFQLSVNFTSERVGERILEALFTLHTLLREIGVRFIFWDDLVWQRLPVLTDRAISRASRACVEQGIEPCLIKTPDAPIVLAGNGAQARLVLDKSTVLRGAGCSSPLDPRAPEFHDLVKRQIEHGHSVSVSTKPLIYIAAVQSAPDIFSRLTDRYGDDIEIIQDILV